MKVGLRSLEEVARLNSEYSCCDTDTGYRNKRDMVLRFYWLCPTSYYTILMSNAILYYHYRWLRGNYIVES
jgi:hypothetical protein